MSAYAAGVPQTLVSVEEGEPIHSAIVRKETWTLDPVRRLREQAEKRAREGPWSVTTDRPPDLQLDVHDYYSEAPFWWPDPEHPGGPYVRKEGQVNPNRFTANRVSLKAMCDNVFTLGTAAYLLDEPRYAQRAARVIHVWFVSARTRMNPDLEFAQAVRGVNQGRALGLLDGRDFIRAIQGMEFLAQTGSWDVREQAAVRKWFEEYLRWLTHSRSGDEEKQAGNNQASWWAAQTAAVASFVESRPDELMAFDFYRNHIFPRQIWPNGSAPGEEARNRSLSYSAFNVEAYAVICRVAQVEHVNLWDMRAKNGATLASVIDYLGPFLSEPKKWAKEQVSEFSNDGLYFLAFAGMGLQKPAYVALYRKLERPEDAWLSLIDLIVGRWENAGHQTRH